MDIIEKYQVLFLMKKQFIGNPQCSNGSPYDLKEHKMLYGDCMFLSATLLKLYGAINGYYYTVSRFFLVKLQFSGKSQCFYGSPYGIKEHKNDEMFLSTLFLKHVSPMRCVLYI